MSFLNISFKYTNTEVSYHLQDLVTAKLQSLEKYIGSKDDNLCEIEFEKIAPHQNGELYRVEVNISTDGQLFRAVDTASSFDKAIDGVRSDLDAELQKDRTKKMSNWMKGARKIKEMMRWGR